MDIKIVILLIFSISATSWAYRCGPELSHDFIQGNRQYLDKLLFTSREKMNEAHKFEWPPSHKHGIETITRIEVLDQKKDGTGGCTYLTDGGIGEKYVNLYLQVQPDGDFDFIINIYGRYFI